MHFDEFKSWLNQHTLAFPMVARNFREGVSGPREKLWFGVLKDIEAQDAAAATDAMLSDETLQPSRFEQHPARIKKLADTLAVDRKQREIFAQFGEGTREGCTACKGELWVYVAPWSKETVLAGSQEMEPAHGLVFIPCQCNPDPQWKHPYDPTKHGPCFRFGQLWTMPNDHPARSEESLKLRYRGAKAPWQPMDSEENKERIEALKRRVDKKRALIDGLGRNLDAERRERWRKGTKVKGAAK